jgi:hypothetical protein
LIDDACLGRPKSASFLHGFALLSSSGPEDHVYRLGATNWPPLLLPAGVMSATPGSGVSASKLGTIKRPE